MKHAGFNVMTPLAIASMALAGCNQSGQKPAPGAGADGLDRTVLPIKEPYQFRHLQNWTREMRRHLPGSK